MPKPLKKAGAELLPAFGQPFVLSLPLTTCIVHCGPSGGTNKQTAQTYRAS